MPSPENKNPTRREVISSVAALVGIVATDKMANAALGETTQYPLDTQEQYFINKIFDDFFFSVLRKPENQELVERFKQAGFYEAFLDAFKAQLLEMQEKQGGGRESGSEFADLPLIATDQFIGGVLSRLNDVLEDNSSLKIDVIKLLRRLATAVKEGIRE